MNNIPAAVPSIHIQHADDGSALCTSLATAISLPYSTILQENGTTDRGLSPSILGSPVPSPTSSFGSSLSPPLFYDSLAPSDNESPISPSPATPEQQFYWPPQVFGHQSSESLALCSFTGSFQDGSALPPAPQTCPRRSRSASSPSSRREPVASKAMLEANSRRRRHPAQFVCEDCQQTFTALFSLKRHAQSHTGEKPFACSIRGCSQRFYNSSDCKRHEKSKKRHKDLPMQ
ncbi:hypothetical protein HD554DRAFT_2037438 [Boletus coccyginus]|nr:hypothetical protein HD554DRAFT_2037438 [Boletus coccyginus]